MFRIFSGINKKVQTLFFVLFGVIFFLLAVVNAKRIDGNYYNYAILYLVAVIFFSYLILKIKNKWLFLIGLSVLAMALRSVWIFFADTQPVSDFSLLNKAANLILEGKYSEVKAIDYFNVWVYQLGFSVYCAVLYVVFGSNILVVKIFNAILSTGIVMIVYFITAKIFNEKAARISSFLYAIYLQSVIFNSLLTNQIISAFFIYLGILIIAYGKGWFWYLLSGISIAVGHIMRPEGSFALYMIAISIVAYNILNSPKKREMFSMMRNIEPIVIVLMLSKIAVLVLSFNLTVQLFSYSLKAADITDYSFGNRNVYWKFVLGLNSSTNGGYSNEDVKILNEYPVGEELYRAEKEVIRERLSNKRELIKLMIRKFNIMWTHNDSSIQFIYPGTQLTSKQINHIVGFEKIQFTLLMFLVCFTVFMSIKSKMNDMNLFIIMMLISANFVVYLLIEIQTRYRYFIIPAFFILSGYCLAAIIEYIECCFKPRSRMGFLH